MDDIKRVISFDSVEEFWGWVYHCSLHDWFQFLLHIEGYTTILFRLHSSRKRLITIFSRSETLYPCTMSTYLCIL